MIRIWFCITACITLAGVALATCDSPKALQARVLAHPDASVYRDLGEWFAIRHQYNCAAEAFQSGLKFSPKSASLSYLLGLSLYSSGSIADAVEPLERSTALDEKALKPRLILAAALTQLNRLEDAEVQWRAAVGLDPKSTIALNGLSNILINKGDFASAISLLSKVPLDETLALDLALALGKSGRLDEAANTLTRALQTHPQSLALTTGLVTVLVNQARYQDAELLAKKIMVMRPNDIAAQRLYLRVAVLNSDAASARPLGQKLLASAPHDFELLYLNGILERKAGEYEAARRHLEEAVGLQNDHGGAHYELGVTLVQLRDERGAQEQLERSIQLGFAEPEARFELAKVLRSLGESEAAQHQLDLYQQASQARSKATLAATKAAQGNAEFDSGNAQKAVALYREALEDNPEDAVIAYKLGLALDKTGDTDAERVSLEQAVRIDPNLALAQNQLGYLASRNGDNASAEEHFRLALRAAPDYTQAWVSLAATLGMESRFKEALEAVSTALRLDPHNAEALQLRRDLTASQGQQPR
jgi:Flp pilus assembly protein TadD